MNIINLLEEKVHLCQDAKLDQMMVCTKWCCLPVSMPRGFSAKVNGAILTSAYPLLLYIIVMFFSSVSATSFY
jgi:hypothetical protein